MADGVICEECSHLNTCYHEKCLKCDHVLPEKAETPKWVWGLVGVAVIVLWLIFK